MPNVSKLVANWLQIHVIWPQIFFLLHFSVELQSGSEEVHNPARARPDDFQNRRLVREHWHAGKAGIGEEATEKGKKMKNEGTLWILLGAGAGTGARGQRLHGRGSKALPRLPSVVLGRTGKLFNSNPQEVISCFSECVVIAFDTV